MFFFFNQLLLLTFHLARVRPAWRRRPRPRIGFMICLLILIFGCVKRAQPKRASLSFARPKRARLSFAFLLYLPPLWRAARPQSECSVGSPVIICLLFRLPTLLARGPSGPAHHCLSALFAPVRVLAHGLSSERALRRWPSYHFPVFMARGPSVPAYLCLSAQLARVMAHGKFLERALRRRPSYHLPFVSFAHIYGARPERASLSLPFCPIFPRYGVRPERASLSFAFLLKLPPFWRAARAGQLIYIQHGPSGPAYHLRSPSEPAYHFGSPSGPVCHLSLCLICGAPRSVWQALHGRADALLFYLERSRMRSPWCPRPPNTHALRTKWRQDPLDLSFWSFLTFFHHGIEEVERNFLWKYSKKIQRKSWSNVPPKLLACIVFHTKLNTKTTVSENSIALGRLNLTFLSLGLSLWNLAHLFTMFMATKSLAHTFYFFA